MKSFRRGGFFQDLFPLDVPVEVDGASLTGTVAQGGLVLPHLVAGPPGQLKSRALILVLAIEDVPAGGQHHEVTQAGQGKTPLVDEMVDLLNLLDVEG